MEMRDKNGLTALLRSIAFDDLVYTIPIDFAKLLIESGANVKAADKEEKNTALHFLAIWCKDEDEASLMKLCIDKGANLDVKSKAGDTPLMTACECNNSTIITIRTLIKLGADVNFLSAVNAVNNSCCTEVLELLIDSGCDINGRDRDGNTLMMLVARNSYDKVQAVSSCSLLLKKGVDIDAQNEEGRTALYYASYRTGNEKLCQYFLENGANTRRVDCDGNTTLFRAQSVKIVNILLVCYHHYILSLLFLMKFY